MKHDKRLYERVVIDIPATIYIGNNEFPVTIKNISENGVAFLCKDDIALKSLLTTDAFIQFQSIDNYELFNIVHNDIISGQGRVIHFDEGIIGVALKSPKELVENIEVVQEKVDILLEQDSVQEEQSSKGVVILPRYQSLYETNEDMVGFIYLDDEHKYAKEDVEKFLESITTK